MLIDNDTLKRIAVELARTRLTVCLNAVDPDSAIEREYEGDYYPCARDWKAIVTILNRDMTAKESSIVESAYHEYLSTVLNLEARRATKLYNNLTTGERSELQSALVLGCYDWQDWFSEPPSKKFMRTLTYLLRED